MLSHRAAIVRFHVVACFILSPVKLAATKNYCPLNIHHTMCMYKATSSLCVKYNAVKNQETIERIVKEHNKARSKYASGHSGFFVSNMLKLYWDQELADISARWSCQCKSREDRFRDVDRFKVAQIVWSQQDSQTYHTWSELWNRILNSDSSGFYVRDYWGNMISNTNQSNPLKIIYNPTVKYLGCTLARYQVWVETDHQLVYKTTLVCNYGPYEGGPKETLPEDWPCRECPPDHPCFTEYYVMRNIIPENLPDERNLCIDPKLENSKPRPGKPCKSSKTHQLLETLHEQGAVNGPITTDQWSFDEWNDTQSKLRDLGRQPEAEDGDDHVGEEEQPESRSAEEPVNYCNIVCRSGEMHTMCKYKEDHYEDEELDGHATKKTTTEKTPHKKHKKSTTEKNQHKKHKKSTTTSSANNTDGNEITEIPRTSHRGTAEPTEEYAEYAEPTEEAANSKRQVAVQRELKQRVTIPPERLNYTTVEPNRRTKIPPSVITEPPTTISPHFENGRRCRNYWSMTNALVINDMLHLHNQYRNDFAEGTVGSAHYLPGNMLIMQWDKGLQDIAERWIRQCELIHDSCRDAVFEDPWSGSMRLFEVGQNIGYRRFTNVEQMPSHRDLFNDWLNQSDSFKGRSKSFILEFRDSGERSVCEYSQIVWAATYLVGCAFAVYEDTISRVAVLMCNYAPIGCSRGKPVYIPGGPCTSCDSESAFEYSRCVLTYPNLCSLEWEPDHVINVTNHLAPSGPQIAALCSSIIFQIVINYYGMMI